MSVSEFLAESKRIEEAATPIVRSGLDFGWVEWSGDGPVLCGPAIETHRGDGADADFIAHARAVLPRMREALEAVLALHYLAPDPPEFEEHRCAECGQGYPCESIHAIESALAENGGTDD